MADVPQQLAAPVLGLGGPVADVLEQPLGGGGPARASATGRTAPGSAAPSAPAGHVPAADATAPACHLRTGRRRTGRLRTRPAGPATLGRWATTGRARGPARGPARGQARGPARDRPRGRWWPSTRRRRPGDGLRQARAADGRRLEEDREASTGDRHAGRALRQVHLVDEARYALLAAGGHGAGRDLGPGYLGENVTTAGVDLLAPQPPARSSAWPGRPPCALTGVRHPRHEDPATDPVGLCLDADGVPVGRVGVFAVVETGGEVRAGDRVACWAPGTGRRCARCEARPGHAGPAYPGGAMQCSYLDAGLCRSCTRMGVPHAQQVQDKERLCRELLGDAARAGVAAAGRRSRDRVPQQGEDGGRRDRRGPHAGHPRRRRARGRPAGLRDLQRRAARGPARASPPSSRGRA